MTALNRFERLALPHMDAAHNLAFWLVRSRPDAEDVVQDAYLRAFRAFGSFEGQDIKPWLLTIVRNVAYRFLTNRRRGGNVISLDEAFTGRDGETGGELQIASDEPSAEDRLLVAGDQRLVLAALAQLPPAFREVIVLRELEDLSYREIADLASVPIGTVMSRLSRARAEMKKILTRLIEKDEPNAV